MFTLVRLLRLEISSLVLKLNRVSTLRLKLDVVVNGGNNGGVVDVRSRREASAFFASSSRVLFSRRRGAIAKQFFELKLFS